MLAEIATGASEYRRVISLVLRSSNTRYTRNTRPTCSETGDDPPRAQLVAKTYPQIKTSKSFRCLPWLHR